ncbi:cell division cycle protein 23 homolog [Styela clava]
MAPICNKFKPKHMKYEILCAIKSCQLRGLLQTVKWLAELSVSLKCDPETPQRGDGCGKFVIGFDVDADGQHTNQKPSDNFTLAKSYFDLGEYDRCAHFLSQDTSKLGYFLHVYSRYLSALKTKQVSQIDNHNIAERSLSKNEDLRTLRVELCKKHKNKELDSFALYLYGIVLKKTSDGAAQQNEAVNILCQSVREYPMNWSAWYELSTVVADQAMLATLHLPKHWMRDFFLALTNVDLINTDDAIPIYNELKLAGFAESTHIKTQEAMAHHNKREFDEAITILEDIRKDDPFRIEHMDILSNMYYVKGRRAELAHLAHHCTQVDKYRVETCCIIGNYYSIRSNHNKSVMYFQRALKLDPHYLGAWTLMGHEYTEVKNTSAAIQAYRNAVDLNRRDYRAWYGLGQTYELLKMPSYSLYYYKQAHRLRPFDSRMLMALGDTYEALQRPEEAKMCFRKTVAVGDIEGMAHVRLAKLYKTEDKKDWAAHYYDRFVQQLEEHGIVEGTSAHTEAYLYLANYHLKTSKNLDAATHYAHKCREYPEVREDGMAVLRQVSQIRACAGSRKEERLPVNFTQPTPSHLQDSVGMDTDSPSANFAPMKLTFSPGQADSDTSNLM